MHRLLRLLAVPALLAVIGLATTSGRAEESDGGIDLGDQSVPFTERVNRAIDGGVVWLRARPKIFTIPGTDAARGAHWGFIKGTQLYGGGQGEGYGHPAGATALALYTLLKCGVSPKEPVIQHGFEWLRSVHRPTMEWNQAQSPQRSRRWTHTLVGGSYELSMMTLALTALYDPNKKHSKTMVVRRKGKLKIKDREDRVWLQQLVDALVHRRGQPTPAAVEVDAVTVKRLADPKKDERVPLPAEPLPPPEERLGWRYNQPHIDLVVTEGRSRSSYRIGGGGTPPHANQDLSSTQLATLALFAAHQFRVDIPLDVWFDIVEFTLAHQEDSGPNHERHAPGMSPAPVDQARGFMYIKGSPDGSEGKATGSMTACGIANLLMASQAINESSKGKKRWSEMAMDRRVQTAIWDGLAWLDRNWSDFKNPKSTYGYHTYYLYAIERAQDLRGKQLVGKHVWYQEGALALLSRIQKTKVKDPFDKRRKEETGLFWNTNSTHEPKDVLDTCFALLFLKRATKNMGPPITPGDGGRPIDNR